MTVEMGMWFIFKNMILDTFHNEDNQDIIQ